MYKSVDLSLAKRSALWAKFGYCREERRIRKWRKMIGAGGSDWKHYVRKNPHVVKRRIRKGIPDCLRGLVWQLISGSRDLLLMNPGVYEVLIIILLAELFGISLALLELCIVISDKKNADSSSNTPFIRE
jgi:hypothetical protein